MKILFVTWHFGCLRNFEAAILELATRGHQVHLAATQEESQGGLALVQRLADATPNVTIGWTPSVATQSERDIAERIRLGLDYLRYLDPAYEQAPRLRTRAEERTPRSVLWLSAALGLRGSTGRARLGAMLGALERALPHNPAVDEYLRDQAPDVALFTPLIGLGSPEVEYLAAARRLGLRTVFCAWSWDNLSSKSLLRDLPDAVTVWNDTQKQEAMALHAVPADHIIVTGAQCFDHWFDRRPSRTREQLCAQLGLSTGQPYLLYVCSALFRGSPPEAAFVRRWVQAIRSSTDPAVRALPILVRPHPSRTAEWRDVTLDDLDDVAVFGGNPMTPESRSDYFDSLYHSGVVVGLNTSAMLEAGIIGKPVMALLLPEFAENQEGTLHFHYLLDERHGLLHVSRSLEEHVRQISDVLREPTAAAARSVRFVDHFIRPFGRDVTGTTRFVAAVEQVLSRPANPPPAQVPAAGLARWVVSHAGGWPIRPVLLSPREYDELKRRAAHLRIKRRDKLVRQAFDQFGRARRWWERSRRHRARAAVERQIKCQKRHEKSLRQREKRRRQARARRERLQQLITQRLRHLLGAPPQ